MQPEPAAVASLTPLAEINDLALELMSQRAAGAAEALPAILRESVDLWRGLAPRPRQRLAACPFLLIDIGSGGCAAAPGLHAGVREPAAEGHWFAEESLPRLSYLTLTYAWHVVQTRQLAARTVLGLADECAAWLGGLSLRQLGEWLEGCPRVLRPRWAGSPAVWRHLLTAAASAEPADFEPARLRGMQLLAAAYWPAARPR